MANHKKPANASKHKGCGLCKAHKQMGNSLQSIKIKYRQVRATKEIFDSD